jgi:tetratricopeptide (TPR) repeat protein
MMRKTLTTGTLGCLVAVVAGCATSASPLERGIAQYREGNYFFAAAEFDEAVRHDPGSVDAYVNRGVARVRLGRLNEAIDDYNRAIQLDNHDPEIYFNRGNALVAAGQYGPAVEDFTRAVELSPVYARAWFNRGSARALAGQTDAAMKDWLHGIDVESDPWARAAMRRSAGLERGPAMAAAVGVPTTASTVAPPPPAGMATGAVPLPPPATVAATPPTAPAASPPTPQSIDARALATRGISRHLDGDRAGALLDLRAARDLETDPVRRASLEELLQMLEAPR